MFEPASVIVGLEIGTSKVCAVVGEVNAAGALNIVGVGQARSRGVRKGEIADASAAGEDVRNAIVEAEKMADVEIRSVYLGVTGGHIRGFNNRGVHPVVSADRSSTTMISSSTPRCASKWRMVCSIRASSSRAAMTTEQRTGFVGDD